MDELSGGHFFLVDEVVNLGVAIYNMRLGLVSNSDSSCAAHAQCLDTRTQL